MILWGVIEIFAELRKTAAWGLNDLHWKWMMSNMLFPQQLMPLWILALTSG
jgi:hypothetical protein